MTSLRSSLFAVALLGLAAPQSPEPGAQVLRLAAGRALQGNAAEAVALLANEPETSFSDKDRAVRACMIERFGPAPDQAHASGNGDVTGRVLRLFRSYWRSALLRPDTKPAEEERLTAGLQRLLNLPPDAGADAVQEAVRQRLAADGHHVLMGRTPPLLEFISWRSETSEVRRVPLPEGEYAMEVRILDDFVSLGWSAYATCDRSFTGGWVKPDAIYAVRPGWKDLTAENFQISFLVHETQHFADKERFGNLESWELEYRGKLAELALADVTLARLLSAFESNQGVDPAVPHSYANRVVLSWLAIELGADDPAALAQASPNEIRTAARALLARDSASREALRTGIADQ